MNELNRSHPNQKYVTYRNVTLNKDNLLIFDINSLLTGRGVGPSSKVLMTRPLFCIIYYSITSSLSLQFSYMKSRISFLRQMNQRPLIKPAVLLHEKPHSLSEANYSMISPFDSQTFLYQKKESFLLRLKSPVPSSCLLT